MKPTPEEITTAMAEIDIQIHQCPKCRFDIVVRGGKTPESCPGCHKPFDGPPRKSWPGRPPGRQVKPPRADHQFPF